MATKSELANRKSSKSPTHRTGVSWIIRLACVPFVLIVVVLCYAVWGEFRAWSAVKSHLTKLNQSGIPFDNASLNQQYLDSTHDEGVAEWVEIYQTVTALRGLNSIQRLPIVGSNELKENLNPDQPWVDEPVVAEFLRELQPILHRIHRATSYPAPIRFPMKFAGYRTTLEHVQESREIGRLLELDFVFACYHRDTERAMRDLQSMKYLAKTIDCNICIVSELVCLALQGTQRRAIRRSLEYDLWNEFELEQLRTIQGETLYTAKRWKTVFQNERALMIQEIQAGDLHLYSNDPSVNWLPLLPSSILRILEVYDQIAQFGDEQLANTIRSTQAFEKQFLDTLRAQPSLSNAWLELVIPTISSYALSYVYDHDDLRFTSVAIALRVYEKRNGRWPKELRELQDVGLSADHCSTLQTGMFGYEVADDAAYVWSYRNWTKNEIPMRRPSIDEASGERDWQDHLVKLNPSKKP